MVLDRPEIPLHTNGSERDIRLHVTKRKISGGTRSLDGRDCRDAFLGLMRTAAKLGIAFWDYLATGSAFQVNICQTSPAVGPARMRQESWRSVEGSVAIATGGDSRCPSRPILLIHRPTETRPFCSMGSIAAPRDMS